MTRDEAREFAKVMQAYADGKNVQWCDPAGDRPWHDDFEPDFDTNFKWRIKPEPRERWMVDGGAIPLRIFGSPEEALRYAASFGNERPPVVRMREVTE